jgi:hypothetical protein
MVSEVGFMYLMTKQGCDISKIIFEREREIERERERELM